MWKTKKSTTDYELSHIIEIFWSKSKINSVMSNNSISNQMLLRLLSGWVLTNIVTQLVRETRLACLEKSKPSSEFVRELLWTDKKLIMMIEFEEGNYLYTGRGILMVSTLYV